MEGPLSVLDGSNDCWKIQISPAKIDSEDEDIEDGQVTPQHVLDSLSRYTVRKNGAYSRTSDVCLLCHCTYSIGDRVACLPCRHNFHEYCIENWLKWVKSTCPVDKKSVVRKECLRQVESERYHTKIQRLLLKEKNPNNFPTVVPAPQELEVEAVPSPGSGKKELRIASPPAQADPKSKELRAIVTSTFRRRSSRSNRCKGSRMEEVPKSADEPSYPCSRTFKQNPTSRSPTTPKSTKSPLHGVLLKKRINILKQTTQSAGNPRPRKCNPLDYLKSLDTPWTRPVVVTSYPPARRHSPRDQTFFSYRASEAKQRCSREGPSMDCEGQRPFQKVTSRTCLTSAGLRYSKERKGGWIYKNDVNLSLKRSGLDRKPKTASF